MRSWNDDPHTRRARLDHFKARSVYKLEEIDKRERLLQGAKLIVDLGAAPGSWTQYCLRQAPQARILAVDMAPLAVRDPRIHFHQQSALDLDPDALLGGSKADLVLSDMAPKTSGIHDRDVALSLELAQAALRIAGSCLGKQGSLVVKIFMGESFPDFQAACRGLFHTVKVIRPESVRKRSREIYLVGRALRQPSAGRGL